MHLKSMIVGLLALAGSGSALAGEAVDILLAGQRLAASCSACHGTDGRTVGDALPALAGQPKEALVASLQAFKSGQRESTIMRQIARGYTDRQIEQMAAYFAAVASASNKDKP